MLKVNHSQGSKRTLMKCLFVFQSLFVPLQQLMKYKTLSPLLKGVNSRFLQNENRIDKLHTFAARTQNCCALDIKK